ncbi:MAG TPA: SMC-Scp complex subunit ScpB [Spirochaetia bacterium]|nr:SMC-Scp complex subunit ScpB [Spirochaetia bacterium]
MNLEKEAGLVEAVLFLESEPVELTTIVRATELSKEIVVEALAQLREEYARPVHGLEIVEIAGGYSLVPKTELWNQLRSRYGKKNDNRLSRAALETLAIIAYSQPITRGEIESIRGVQVDSMIRQLIERSLIHEVGKKDVPGKPTQYGTTKDFLKVFHLSSIADLPKLNEVDQERFQLDGE